MKIKILMLLLSNISFYFSTIDGAVINFCANPVPSSNPIDLKWLHENLEEGWNIQFGNPLTRERLAKFTKGVRNPDTENDYSQMCARLKLDYVDNHFQGGYSGYGGKTAKFNCSSTFACDITSSDNVPVGSLQSHFSYFDGKANHNMISVIQCFPNGESGWAVLTRSKTISPEEDETITEHLKSIGFDPEERVPMSSSSC